MRLRRNTFSFGADDPYRTSGYRTAFKRLHRRLECLTPRPSLADVFKTHLPEGQQTKISKVTVFEPRLSEGEIEGSPDALKQQQQK